MGVIAAAINKCWSMARTRPKNGMVDRLRAGDYYVFSAGSGSM
jgi:hypothetical protein